MDTQENALLAGALPRSPGFGDEPAGSGRARHARVERASEPHRRLRPLLRGVAHWLYDGANPGAARRLDLGSRSSRPPSLGSERQVVGLDPAPALSRPGRPLWPYTAMVRASSHVRRTLMPHSSAVVDVDRRLHRIFMLLLDITSSRRPAGHPKVAPLVLQRPAMGGRRLASRWLLPPHAVSWATSSGARVFAIGLAVFSLASLACGLSTHVDAQPLSGGAAWEGRSCSPRRSR